MRFTPHVTLSFVVALCWLCCLGGISGCAVQPIVVAPDAAAIARANDAPPLRPFTVGYYIPVPLLALKVRGDDSTSFYPYRDLEPAYRKMLGNVFEAVYRVNSPTDAEGIRAAGVQLLVSPDLRTSTTATGMLLSTSAMFQAELTSQVRCPSGLLLANPQATGQALNDGKEFVFDRAAAGRRAMQDMLLAMQQALAAAKLDPATVAATCALPVVSLADRDALR